MSDLLCVQGIVNAMVFLSFPVVGLLQQRLYGNHTAAIWVRRLVSIGREAILYWSKNSIRVWVLPLSHIVSRYLGGL